MTNDNPLLSDDRLLAVMTNQNEPNDVMAAAQQQEMQRGVEEEDESDTDRTR